MSEECQGNPKKQTYLLECRPYVDYISKKVCIADPMQTMQTVFVTLIFRTKRTQAVLCNNGRVRFGLNITEAVTPVDRSLVRNCAAMELLCWQRGAAQLAALLLIAVSCTPATPWSPRGLLPACC